ncbi:hypothetical protein AWB64_00737 [Caballeronia sordidicola]|uniref:Uncharacterized protein n=1 Tax=Caballeronia sordidicola TaxID=196367 RepID=A0A158F4D6_CABSO|nr:hypothetical protein [Caballeronia sordidicola]SAL14738.1 hypothetical protein AWB64_00737 [Caballeronia sordidicola]
MMRVLNLKGFQKHLMSMPVQINDPAAGHANAGKLQPAESGRITRADIGFNEVSK